MYFLTEIIQILQHYQLVVCTKWMDGDSSSIMDQTNLLFLWREKFIKLERTYGTYGSRGSHSAENNPPPQLDAKASAWRPPWLPPLELLNNSSMYLKRMPRRKLKNCMLNAKKMQNLKWSNSCCWSVGTFSFTAIENGSFNHFDHSDVCRVQADLLA